MPTHINSHIISLPQTYLTNQIQTQHSIIDHNNHVGILNMLNAFITMHNNSHFINKHQCIIISIMTYAMHRDRHNDYMHEVPIQPLLFISPPRNSWNHRLLLRVTPRRAHDVPRRSHPTWAHDVSGPLTPHKGTRS